MIQQGINQTLGTIGIMGRLSPSYENKQAAGNVYKKGISAQKGIEDIYSSVDRVKRSKSGEIAKDSPDWRPEYSPAELRDIYGRLKEHVSNIGELKTAAIEGQPTAKFIPKDKEGRIAGLAPRPNYSEVLTGLESDLQGMMAPAAAPAVKRSMANNRVVDKAVKAIQQDQAFKERRDAIMNKLGEPPMKPFDEASGRGIQYMAQKEEAAIDQADLFNELRRLISTEYGKYGAPGLITEKYHVPFDLTKEIESISKYEERISKETEEALIKEYGKDYKNNPEYIKQKAMLETLFD